MFNILNIFRSSLFWFTSKNFFGKRIGSSLEDWNCVNYSTFLFFQLLLNFMVLKWEPCSCGYLFPRVLTSICQILISKANNWKQEKIFFYFSCLGMWLNPRTFQVWVFCLVIWAGTSPLNLHYTYLELFEQMCW